MCCWYEVVIPIVMSTLYSYRQRLRVMCWLEVPSVWQIASCPQGWVTKQCPSPCVGDHRGSPFDPHGLVSMSSGVTPKLMYSTAVTMLP
jgi:hypothetical protein